ncbi:hypothetical protein C7974DRAFT_376678 [Boeremia exigua]|uniref:uncharacterized protein n=1 Tax=Boeremia exigua TaxID=749465 RepID=UPI001E8DE31F|nr:uncharacterized protein C7974DRAFT_376678 [Boeremia exigua]KAH6625108.1 hypothetical protein C7974DRAFT_376678 [Boeremia exigua]
MTLMRLFCSFCAEVSHYPTSASSLSDNTPVGFTIGVPAFRRQFGDFMDDQVGYVMKTDCSSAWGGAGVGMQTVGAASSGYVANKFGRRWTLGISAIIVIVSLVTFFEKFSLRRSLNSSYVYRESTRYLHNSFCLTVYYNLIT